MGDQVQAFFGANGPLKLIFFCQVEEREVDGEYQPVPGTATFVYILEWSWWTVGAFYPHN